MEYDELVYACAINRIFNYSCDKARLLVSKFSSPGDIFRLTRRELVEIFGRESHFVDDILNHLFLKKGEEDVLWARDHNVRIFYIGDSDYPCRLKECNDAPVALFYRGNCNLNSNRVVSIVGSRNASEYGKGFCVDLINSFAELEDPPIIVSGLAYGIDITAHKAALDAGLSTVGVMATGLDVIYPAVHRKVAAQMVEQGGILSDFHIKSPPVALNFVRRNRIIAGLSDATILVEARKGGGGVITSKMASSYDREVFALPGRVDDPLSEGCNLLIKENSAEIITGKDSIRSAMGWKNIVKDKLLRLKFLTFESDNDVKKGVVMALARLKQGTVDELAECTGCGRGELMVSLTELELEGRITSDLLGQFKLV